MEEVWTKEMRQLTAQLQEMAEEFYTGKNMEGMNECLWDCVTVFSGFPFYTVKGLQFSYSVKGGEIYIDRREKSKSITRSSVEMAFKIALELVRDGQSNYGPKKLKVFGASYLWSIFKTFGIGNQPEQG